MIDYICFVVIAACFWGISILAPIFGVAYSLVKSKKLYSVRVAVVLSVVSLVLCFCNMANYATQGDIVMNLVFIVEAFLSWLLYFVVCEFFGPQTEENKVPLYSCIVLIVGAMLFVCFYMGDCLWRGDCDYMPRGNVSTYPSYK